MYRARRRDFGSTFTFGGRLPASVGFTIVLLFVATLGSWMARNEFWAMLRTGTIAEGQLWRLVTYTLVQDEPTALVFGAIALFFFGPYLAMRLGERRFLGYLLVVSVGAGLVTLLLGFVLRAPVLFNGSWPLVDAVVLLWALGNLHTQVLLMFVLPVSGRVLAILTVATNVLWVLWGMSRSGIAGFIQFTPPLAALGIAWVVHRGGFGLPLRRWQLRLREWRLERQYRRRSRHLQVVKKDGSSGPKQWMN